MKNKIDFIITGAQKSGTSAAYYYLDNHAQVEMAANKELHFFDNDTRFSSLRHPYHDYSEYHKYFDFTSGKKVYGECTPSYIYYEPVMQRIHQYNPDIKLVTLLRNPVTRAFSGWNMEMQRAETEDFAYCIQHEKERLQTGDSFHKIYHSYIDRGYYAQQIKRIYQFFDKKQCLFIKYEDFLAHQEVILYKMFDFLGISSDNYDYQYKVAHKRTYDRTITKEEKDYLLNVYKDDIIEVEQLLGWNCDDWKV